MPKDTILDEFDPKYIPPKVSNKRNKGIDKITFGISRKKVTMPKFNFLEKKEEQ